LAIDDLLLIRSHLDGISQEKRTPTVPTRMMNTLDKIVISLTRIDGRLRAVALEV
jgi:hypothetical protein